MIKKQYSGSARRARNIIWNAAGRYDFEPPFMAFFPNGTPDLYFDMIVGFAEKWLDLDAVWAFFRTYEGDRRAEEFDEFLWLGIENCVYEKEVRERPVLADLRRARAGLAVRQSAALAEGEQHRFLADAKGRVVHVFPDVAPEIGGDEAVFAVAADAQADAARVRRVRHGFRAQRHAHALARAPRRAHALAPAHKARHQR